MLCVLQLCTLWIKVCMWMSHVSDTMLVELRWTKLYIGTSDTILYSFDTFDTASQLQVWDVLQWQLWTTVSVKKCSGTSPAAYHSHLYVTQKYFCAAINLKIYFLLAPSVHSRSWCNTGRVQKIVKTYLIPEVLQCILCVKLGVGGLTEAQVQQSSALTWLMWSWWARISQLWWNGGWEGGRLNISIFQFSWDSAKQDISGEQCALYELYEYFFLKERLKTGGNLTILKKIHFQICSSLLLWNIPFLTKRIQEKSNIWNCGLCDPVISSLRI